MFQRSNAVDGSGVRTGLSVALTLGVLAGAAVAVGHVEAATTGMTCRIDIKERAGATVLESIVVSKSSIAGSYDLVITKSGGGGSSDINQSGQFDAAAGSETSLGTVMLGGDAGRYKAKLTVRAGDRAIECRERASGAL